MAKARKPNVVITGVSSGIGLDATREMIAAGWRVFGSVRKEADGARVRAALGENFVPLYFDVTDDAAIASAMELVKAAAGDDGLAGLVNNSGVAPSAPLMHMPLKEFEYAFAVNVFGALKVTQAFLPLLGAKRNCPHPPGRIVNLSSISGGIAFPMVGAYACSKHALEAMTDALRRELTIYGIDVIAIEPGSIRTPIWVKALANMGGYEGTGYADVMARMPAFIEKEYQNGKPVEVVSAAIRKALTARRPKANYPLTLLWALGKLLPRRMIDRIVSSAIGTNR